MKHTLLAAVIAGLAGSSAIAGSPEPYIEHVYMEPPAPAATWDGLKQFYSDRQMLDLLFTLGQYTMVSMVLNSTKVQLEEGFEGL